MGIFTGEEKRLSLAEAAGLIEDGCSVGIGGGLSGREPISLIRELIRCLDPLVVRKREFDPAELGRRFELS